MRKSLKILMGTLILAGAGHAVAASDVDLAVKGLITPSACRPSLASGGIVDYGKISSKDLNPTKPTFLGTRSMAISMTCDSATPFALLGVDNRPGSSSQASFGLGLINGTQKLGWFYLTWEKAVADGVEVKSVVSEDAGHTWYDYSWFDPGVYVSVAAIGGSSLPISVKELAAELNINTSIARTDGLDLSNEVSIDGSVTLEVKYL
ncbi:DUF1120 domain-containing protein [Pseudomonas trivialis]|uniref:DUF1120 domain-containing protein n=1 Tax=Pseudomonas trivialis TaxID=200450 RepID=UPI0030D00C61